MKLILYQATITITEIDFVLGPFRCQIDLGHLDFAVARLPGNFYCGCFVFGFLGWLQQHTNTVDYHLVGPLCTI
jgi:uncharacterized membrane protein